MRTGDTVIMYVINIHIVRSTYMIVHVTSCKNKPTKTLAKGATRAETMYNPKHLYPALTTIEYCMYVHADIYIY